MVDLLWFVDPCRIGVDGRRSRSADAARKIRPAWVGIGIGA